MASGLKLPPAPPSDHVPPVADPPTEPPKAEEVPPLQIALKALPALAVTHGLRAIIMPPIVRGFVFGVHVKPALPVAPGVVFIAQAAPTATVLSVFPSLPASDISVRGDGLVIVQDVKLVDAKDLMREQFPNTTTAAFAVTVVIEGILDITWFEVVVHDVGLVTSKGVLLLTPEKATIEPVAAETKTASGIILTESLTRKEQAGTDEGIILALGDTFGKDFGAEVLPKVGDKILFAKYAGKFIKDGDTDLVLLNDEDLLAIVKDEDA